MNFEKLLQNNIFNLEYENLKIDFNQSYIKTYPYFVDYFKNLKEITYENLVISSHFVYGWMPTIIKLGEADIEKTIQILNSIKQNQQCTNQDIELIKSNINNSLVGTSKLLHFINPKEFAIWDSRIVRYITGTKYPNGIEKVENYIEYNGILKNIICRDIENQIVIKKIKDNFKYSISDLRVAELILFELHKHHQNLTKKSQ